MQCLHLQEKLKGIKKDLGAKELGKVTVDMCIGGMRGIPVRGSIALGWCACLLELCELDEQGLRCRVFHLLSCMPFCTCEAKKRRGS
jgi:hypothetical protein